MNFIDLHKNGLSNKSIHNSSSGQFIKVAISIWVQWIAIRFLIYLKILHLLIFLNSYQNWRDFYFKRNSIDQDLAVLMQYLDSILQKMRWPFCTPDGTAVNPHQLIEILCNVYCGDLVVTERKKKLLHVCLK